MNRDRFRRHLLCREVSLNDPDVKTLRGGIIRSQRQQIDQIKAILARN